MKAIKQLLTEKTFNLDKDVESIFKKYFKSNLKKVRGAKISHYPETVWITSSELKSKDAKAAHEKNPIKLSFWNERGQNSYNPIDNKITITPSTQVAEIFWNAQGDLDQILDDFGKKQTKEIIEEYSDRNTKDSIYHELSHWVDDSLHNGHLTKTVKRARNFSMVHKKSTTNKVISRGAKTLVGSDFEINAVIHGLKAFKKSYTDEQWNEITFDDLVDTDPILGITNRETLEAGTNKVWRKNFLRRMAREGLLGKRMKFRK